MSFKNYNLSTEILTSIEKLGFSKPTDVQSKVIPAILEGKNVIIKSQTGSGKTASFAIPICELIDWDNNNISALILTPTRELATQINEDVLNIGKYKRISSLAVYGKEPINKQEARLKQRTNIVVGTPGRVLDLIDRRALDLSKIKHLVIDEADHMFSMGFIDQIEDVIYELPKNIQTILLSATIPEDISKLVNNISDPIKIEIESDDNVVDRITNEVYYVEENTKLNTLLDLMIMENPDSAIIFCNTREQVDNIHKYFQTNQISAYKLHGGLEQSDRSQIMKDFKRGKKRYLIATDVAARGIDVDDISLVVNFDLPFKSDVFVHRIGRTARIGKEGKSITLISSKEKYYLSNIENKLNIETTKRSLPNIKEVNSKESKFRKKLLDKGTLKEDKGHLINKDILKIQINSGKKAKIRKGDVVGFICNLKGMEATDIGIIEVKDTCTLVEILNSKGDYVYNKFLNNPFKGKMRKVVKK